MRADWDGGVTVLLLQKDYSAVAAVGGDEIRNMTFAGVLLLGTSQPSQSNRLSPSLPPSLALGSGRRS